MDFAHRQIGDFSRFAMIVGAPRCGTTTQSHWLRQHPDVAFPFVKEPHFFSRLDVGNMSEADLCERTEREYLDRFFFAATERQRLGVDGSVSYLYAPEAMGAVLRLWPDSRFIVAVRDPLAMLPSYHARLLVTGDEVLESFADAWDATPDRAAGRRMPRSTIDPRALRYDEVAKFGTYVEQLMAVVGRERLFVSLFDDLVADPETQYRRMCGFLDIQPYDATDFRAQREGRGVKFYSLQRLLMRPPMARQILAGEKYRQRIAKPGPPLPQHGWKRQLLNVREAVLDWNKAPPRRDPVPLRVQEEIVATLSGEINRLQELIGRDLSHWLKPRGAE